MPLRAWILALLATAPLSLPTTALAWHFEVQYIQPGQLAAFTETNGDTGTTRAPWPGGTASIHLYDAVTQLSIDGALDIGATVFTATVDAAITTSRAGLGHYANVSLSPMAYLQVVQDPGDSDHAVVRLSWSFASDVGGGSVGIGCWNRSFYSGSPPDAGADSLRIDFGNGLPYCLPLTLTVHGGTSVYFPDFGPVASHSAHLEFRGEVVDAHQPPVLLVHGVCSTSASMAFLAEGLRSYGLTVYNDLNLSPNSASPSWLAQQLADRLTTIPDASVDLVGYSMGGLVAREYLARCTVKQTPSRVRTLVTLGTPHHGSDVATAVSTRPKLANFLAGLSPELACLARSAALPYMVPGSAFLNQLNYESLTTGVPDPFRSSSGFAHQPELVGGVDRVWAIAGTDPICACFSWLTSGVWKTAAGQPYANDGLVGISSAQLSNPAASNITDTQFWSGPLTHSTGPLFCGTSLVESWEMVGVVAGIFMGYLTPEASRPPFACALEVDSEVDGETSDLESPAGVLAPGQTLEYPFSLSNISRVQVALQQASTARLTLRTPAGASLAPADTSTMPGFSYAADPSLGLENFTVTDPQDGTWTLRVDGADLPGAVDYTTLLTVWGGPSVHAEVASPLVPVGCTQELRAWLGLGGVPQVGATFWAAVLDSAGTSTPVALHDDGAHGDGAAGDGVFGGTAGPLAVAGTYRVTVTGKLDGTARVGGAAFDVESGMDLAVVEGSLRLEREQVSAGDTVIVSADVTNVGAQPVDTVTVEFWDETGTGHIGASSVSLGPNETRPASAVWVAAAPDTHTLRVVVNPFRLDEELSYANNTLACRVILGGVVGVTTGPRRLGFALEAPIPNPATSDVTLHFALGTRAGAQLAILDLQGRRVRAWRWASLAPGPHAVTWDGRLADGAVARPGVYLVRLESAGGLATRKLIRLR